MNKKFLGCLIAMICAIGGCAEIENSAGKVLENAASVGRTADQKLWGKETPIPEDSSTNINRY